MCGIAGLIGDRPVSAGAVAAMTARLAHRGPDGTGLWRAPDGRVILGHRRLRVIDLSARADQPMVDETGQLALTFNGEIYNYRELADRLRAAGDVLRAAATTEILLRAWLRWGEDALAELNGMFSFAIWDGRRRKLFCARDRFGEKPLLFARGAGFFAFASEYKALLALDAVPAEADDRRIHAFLRDGRRGLDDDRATAFPAIEQLLPGERMVVDLDSLAVDIERYWQPRPDPALARLGDTDATARFRDLLDESVRLRLRSDVEVGSCLSGGLDSSAIVCLARRQIGAETPYHAFCGAFPGSGADERAWAEQVARHAGATLHIAEPRPDALVAGIADFVWFNELPVSSTSQYAQWCVFARAREQGVTVLLDGQGGDEILGGYEQYFGAYLAALRASEGSAAAAAEETAIRARYPLALPDGLQRFKRDLPDWLRVRLAAATSGGSDFAFGLSPDARRAAAGLSAPIPANGWNTLSAALREDALVAHLPTLLRYGDRNSMAHSREVRLPFCDHRLAEFAFSLPPRLLMGDAETKRLLRRAMAGILPDAIVRRWNKRGFLPPQDDWMDGPLGDAVAALFGDPAFAARGCWNVGWWRQALVRFRRGERHLAWTLWKVYIAEMWQRHFVDRAAAMDRHAVFAQPQ